MMHSADDRQGDDLVKAFPLKGPDHALAEAGAMFAVLGALTAPLS